ncbi:MAG TPA: bifunctional diaminohydroxyphosphoribosylaminopyrimidine deaminase/5-amino-6-(5-phosphoribosylamino)uracil reductase RibD [Vicinamibacteria bacterium]|nr:bifunctional diaminohydroxyphosphoribosylaminopyrimidine deaminase/5-amino-6-(5-phosphoribosylamino)uracil reductase RibD [Vicinamibacteria bacterium]
MADDERLMRRALELAVRGLGATNPNPMVGCVLVKGRRIVGEGWHRRAGGPHAEVFALRQAGARARGATAYVTLEPCSHHGRTPPCAPRLGEAGVKRVVVAIRDPNPAVSGRGLRLLRRAGLAVEVGVEAEEARRLNLRFLTAARRERPYVLLKVATTLDGRIAVASGDSKWITSPVQRRAARRLRGLHDAVAVGIGTVLADDPLLLPEPRPRRPFSRIVFDSQLRLPIGSRLVRSLGQSPVWAVTGHAPAARRRALEAAGVTVIEVPTKKGRVSLLRALAELRRRGIWSLMVEGGSEVLGGFLAEPAFDHLALFRAPLLLGGRGSLAAFGGPNPERLAEALRLTPVPLAKAPPGLPAGDLCELWAPAGPSPR